MIREALRTLEDGTPRLLFLGTADELAEHQRDGVVTVPIACQSEGALEVYVQPVLPSPHLVVIGRSPAAEALAAMALALGWRSSVYDAEASPGGADGVDGMLEEAAVRPTSMVVVSRGFGSGPLLTAPGRLAVRTGGFAPEAGWNFHGSPGRAWLFAAKGSISFRRSAA